MDGYVHSNTVCFKGHVQKAFGVGSQDTGQNGTDNEEGLSVGMTASVAVTESVYFDPISRWIW